jgi:hypothetical protein
MLAQVTGQAPTFPTPEIAWSSFAPELVPTAAALVLLLVAVAGHRRQALVGVPTAVLGVALGAWLITGDVVVGGAGARGPPPAGPAGGGAPAAAGRARTSSSLVWRKSAYH